MEEYRIKRTHLLAALQTALEPQEYTLAMWEGGAAGFGRVDQWSDADVQVIVKDGFVEQAFTSVEQALSELCEIDYRFRLPEPTWHGHSQCFYRLKDASPYLMLDIVFIQQSSEADRFMQFRTHGQPLIWFDKVGLVKEEPIDIEEMISKMQASLDGARMRYDLFWILTTKEINRGNSIEAIAFYQGYVLRPLLEVLRILHCPVRYFYATRYAHYDLPAEVADRLAALYFPADLKDLNAKFEQARAWFYHLLDEVDWDMVRARLEDK
jgi:hypothetical protein